MVFGTFRIYGYRLCFAVRGFRKRCSMARFRDSFAACFRVLFPSSLLEGSCASSLPFLSVVSVFPRLGMCSCGPKELFLDSKGNVQDFFDRVLAVFGSYPDGVWDFSLLRLPLVFCCSRFSGLWFAVRGFRKRCSRPDFARPKRPKRLFLWIPKVTWKSFLARVLAVFGSCPDGVWDFSHLGLQGQSVFCGSRLSEGVSSGQISRQFCSVFCCSRLSGFCFAVRGSPFSSGEEEKHDKTKHSYSSIQPHKRWQTRCLREAYKTWWNRIPIISDPRFGHREECLRDIEEATADARIRGAANPSESIWCRHRVLHQKTWPSKKKQGCILLL